MGVGVLKKYGEFLPLTEDTPIFSLGEGDTPLVKSNRLGKELGCKELYFKLEGCNPTGSFKDRGMVVAIAKAVEEGAVGIMCASTGNTSASAAAYSAYLDLQAFVLIPKGEVALGKLAQAMAYGARIIMVDGNFDAALALVREFTQNHPITLVNSVNPHRIEGQKTAGFRDRRCSGRRPRLPVHSRGQRWQHYRLLERFRRVPTTGAHPEPFPT